MAERGKSRGGGARTAAIALSVVFHLVLLALLVRYAARTTSAQVEPPTIQALLFPPALSDPDRHDRLRSAAPNHRDVRGRAGRQALLAHALSPGEAASIAPGVALPAIGADVAAGPPPRLQGLGSCQRPDLTRREREDCEARRWADAAPANPRLNLGAGRPDPPRARGLRGPALGGRRPGQPAPEPGPDRPLRQEPRAVPVAPAQQGLPGPPGRRRGRHGQRHERPGGRHLR